MLLSKAKPPGLDVKDCVGGTGCKFALQRQMNGGQEMQQKNENENE